jgi:uncharacterized LabA/DUF88 family protein
MLKTLSSSFAKIFAPRKSKSQNGQTPPKKGAKPGNRVAIFIDGSNLYHALDENCGRMDLDFTAFIKKLCGNRELFRAYYYNILQDSDRRGHAYQEQQKFLNTLYQIPYLEVRLGTSKFRGDVLVEKGVDIMMATDILQYAWRDLYDVVILVSGDGDFAYAIQAVKNFGKHVEIAAFRSNLSHELAQNADYVFNFDRNYFYELWVGGHRRRYRDQDRQPSREEVGHAGWRQRRYRNPQQRNGDDPGSGPNRPAPNPHSSSC